MPPIDIRFKRGTASFLSAQNAVLAEGEPCLELDTGRVKYGDGITPWQQLAYATSGSAGGASLPGTNNTVTGVDAFAGGGADNTVSGARAATVGGLSGEATAARAAIVGGQDNVASKSNAVVLGGHDNLADGNNAAVLGGAENIAAGLNSVAMGKEAVATKDAQIAMSAGSFSAVGDAQSSIYHLRGRTTNATPTRLYINGTTGHLSLAPGAAWAYEIRLVAYDNTDQIAGAWKVHGGIHRDFLNNITLSAPAVVTAFADEWPEGAGVSVSADSANFALAVNVTGVAAHDIQWHATVNTTELVASAPLVSDMFVEVLSESAITSLSVTIDNNQLTPAFSTGMTDYSVRSSADFFSTTPRNYSIVINGGTPITGTITVNKALRIRAGTQDYFVRVLPSDFPLLPTVVTKTPQHIPGYYLVTFETTPYFVVYTGDAVPVWYTRADASLCSGNVSLHAGWEPNRFMTNGDTHNCDRWDIKIGLNTLTAKPYTMINPSTRNTNHTWEIHESHAIRAPLSRKGNIIYQSYDSTGFYIQEQNPQNQIVWEWWSDDYFTTTYSDYFHLNSIDVHPVTGDILLSTRHNGAVFAINYLTKEIIWLLENSAGDCFGGPLFPLRKQNMTANTKWLTPFNEPSTYTGTDSQHDARWHVDFPVLTAGNTIVSVSDNQSCGSRAARGVIYEIDLVNNRAVFRSQVYSPRGSTPYRGSYTLLKELNNSFTHSCFFPAQNPNFVEFSSDVNGNGTQNITLEIHTNAMETQSFDQYRMVKVRSDFLDLNYMRTSAGRVPTIV